jgi:hypothetical protein
MPYVYNFFYICWLICFAFAEDWPTNYKIITVDSRNEFQDNLSGLQFESSGNGSYIWAVQNNPSKIFKLIFDGVYWTSDQTENWGTGKTIHYMDGKGYPDSEDLVKTKVSSTELYICAERDNDNDDKSRLSVLRYQDNIESNTLVATNEWIFNDLIDVDVPANTGFEALTWIDDLSFQNFYFIDDSTGENYNPDLYPHHGDGLFAIGLECKLSC